MKRKLLSLRLIAATVICAGIGKLSAQQDPYMTHYMFNRSLYNPAVAGANGLFCASVLSHYQYLGYEDRTPEFWPDPQSPNQPGKTVKNVGPKTNLFTFTAPVTRYAGLGLAIMSDKLGYEANTHIKIQGAGHLPVGQFGAKLSAGFEANILQKSLDGAQLRPLVPGDPSIPASKVSDNHTVFSAGVYYTNPMVNSMSVKDLWIGGSINNINQPKYYFGSSTFSVPDKHFYLSGGATMPNFLGRSNIEFKPSAQFKYNSSVFQFDLTALACMDKKLWGGVAYRGISNKFNDDAFSIILGYSGFQKQLAGLRIGYSYDLTTSRILSVSSGTHEIQLNYCFEIKIVPPEKVKIVTPPWMHRDDN